MLYPANYRRPLENTVMITKPEFIYMYVHFCNLMFGEYLHCVVLPVVEQCKDVMHVHTYEHV